MSAHESPIIEREKEGEGEGRILVKRGGIIHVLTWMYSKLLLMPSRFFLAALSRSAKALLRSVRLATADEKKVAAEDPLSNFPRLP